MLHVKQMSPTNRLLPHILLCIYHISTITTTYILLPAMYATRYPPPSSVYVYVLVCMYYSLLSMCSRWLCLVVSPCVLPMFTASLCFAFTLFLFVLLFINATDSLRLPNRKSVVLILPLECALMCFATYETPHHVLRRQPAYNSKLPTELPPRRLSRVLLCYVLRTTHGHNFAPFGGYVFPLLFLRFV